MKSNICMQRAGSKLQHYRILKSSRTEAVAAAAHITQNILSIATNIYSTCLLQCEVMDFDGVTTIVSTIHHIDAAPCDRMCCEVSRKCEQRMRTRLYVETERRTQTNKQLAQRIAANYIHAAALTAASLLTVAQLNESMTVEGCNQPLGQQRRLHIAQTHSNMHAQNCAFAPAARQHSHGRQCLATIRFAIQFRSRIHNNSTSVLAVAKGRIILASSQMADCPTHTSTGATATQQIHQPNADRTQELLDTHNDEAQLQLLGSFFRSA